MLTWDGAVSHGMEGERERFKPRTQKDRAHIMVVIQFFLLTLSIGTVASCPCQLGIDAHSIRFRFRASYLPCSISYLCRTLI